MNFVRDEGDKEMQIAKAVRVPIFAGNDSACKSPKRLHQNTPTADRCIQQSSRIQNQHI